MRRLVFAVPGDLATPTGGYAYDRHIVAELERIGWGVEVADIGSGFPRASAEALELAHRRLTAVGKGTPIMIDGLAFGVMDEIAPALRTDHPVIALVHHPLARESGIAADEAKEFHRREKAALVHTSHVIVTSPATARLLTAEYGVAADRITIALPGNDARPVATGSRDGTLALLAVGSLVRRKGYDVLIAALAALPDLAWRLTVAGDRTRNPEVAAALDAQIDACGLGRRIDILGAVTDARLDELFASADLFVLPSRFEGYGIAFAEAIAHGLPVIGTTAGAIPDTVPAEAGVLVPPDDIEALTAALRRLMTDGGERRRLAAAALAAAARLPTWRESAELIAHAIEAAQ